MVLLDLVLCHITNNEFILETLSVSRFVNLKSLALNI